jgi:DNA-binding NtrC family response regulator
MTNALVIVDDEAEIREALSRHFRFLGYAVKTAATGEEVLAILANERVDVLISDIRMPGMSGVELLKAVKREYPMLHAIMITGYVNQDSVFSCMRYGADTCIFKPWPDLVEIESAVTAAVTNIRTWKQKLRQLAEMKPTERKSDG